MKSRQAGFTLIEVVAVAALLGVLVTMIMPSLDGANTKVKNAKLRNIETVEKLWDRVFGKGQMQLNLPEQQQLQTGIIPNVPISREAYIVIRDTLIK